MYKYISLFVLYFAILVCPESAKAADWPTFMHDSHRSGVTGEQLKLPLNETWVFKAAHRPQPAWPGPAQQDFWHRTFNLKSAVTYDRAFHVVGADNTIFFGSSADDKVYALDARTGKERWTFFTEAPVRLAPAVSGNKVYVGSDDGHVYCLRRDDGTLAWKHKATEQDRMIPGNGRIISTWPVRTGLLVDEGVLYFAAGLFPNQGTFLSALDAEDGSLNWKRKLDISPQGYMLASRQRLYVPTGRTSPAIFSRADGRPLGELPSAGGTFALLTENVLVTGPGRRSRELNAADVDTKDKIATFGGVRMLVNGPTAYMQAERQLSAFNRGRYLELSRERNKLAQRQSEIKKQLKKTARNTADATQLQEQLQSLAPRINELSKQMKDCYLWTVNCKYPYSLIMAGDVLFAGGENEIAAIEARDGKVIWTDSVDGKAYSLSVVNEGLYVSTDQGQIYCFRDGAKVAPAGEDTNPFPRDNLTERYAKAAELIVERTGVAKGYCLVLDCGRGRLAYELARRSDLKIVGVEEDADKVAAARNAIDKAGLYGRVVVHHKDSDSLPYTDYFANLIVSDEALRTGKLPATADEVFRVLRPSGGVVALVQQDNKFNEKKLKEWGLPARLDWKLHKKSDIAIGWAEREKLQGAGEWTHTYAEPGNTSCSGDTIVKGDMALQWFGRPGPKEMIDRHHRNVPPLYKDGRLFVPGDSVVFAVDAYNGTIEWKIEVPNSRRLGVFLDTSNLIVDEKFLYVAAEDKCIGFDVRTGRRRVSHQMPQLRSEPREWSYIAYSGNTLFGSARRKGASYTETSYEADDALWYQDMQLVVSDYLFALDKPGGRLLWKYDSGLVLNTTITIGGGRMYFIETDSPKALADKLGRMPIKKLFDGGSQYLVALDAGTGRVIFKKKIDVTYFEEPVYINYADDTLLLSGSRLAGDVVRYHYRAFDARSGDILWDADHRTDLAKDGGHGEYNRHPTIIDDTVYAWPYAYSLKTGEKTEGWEFNRQGHGCGGVSASAQCLFWRGGNPWMYDLCPGGGPQPLNRATRPGCWINIIPAGGLVLVPEASSGCTCGFSLQTSMAFVPK
ncbi:MAG: outer membrane protein assembly factor BamB family protein [Planctomycetota bacterium]|jgi:outer membrane protein assembly factor BamB